MDHTLLEKECKIFFYLGQGAEKNAVKVWSLPNDITKANIKIFRWEQV